MEPSHKECAKGRTVGEDKERVYTVAVKIAVYGTHKLMDSDSNVKYLATTLHSSSFSS